MYLGPALLIVSLSVLKVVELSGLLPAPPSSSLILYLQYKESTNAFDPSL